MGCGRWPPQQQPSRSPCGLLREALDEFEAKASAAYKEVVQEYHALQGRLAEALGQSSTLAQQLQTKEMEARAALKAQEELRLAAAQRAAEAEQHRALADSLKVGRAQRRRLFLAAPCRDDRCRRVQGQLEHVTRQLGQANLQLGQHQVEGEGSRQQLQELSRGLRQYREENERLAASNKRQQAGAPGRGPRATGSSREPPAPAPAGGARTKVQGEQGVAGHLQQPDGQARGLGHPGLTIGTPDARSRRMRLSLVKDTDSVIHLWCGRRRWPATRLQLFNRETMFVLGRQEGALFRGRTWSQMALLSSVVIGESVPVGFRVHSFFGRDIPIVTICHAHKSELWVHAGLPALLLA